MLRHLRANLWLTALTLSLCCVLYPLTLWAVGRLAFPQQAQGSIVPGGNGSRLVAQPFSGDGYFWPRPSSASCNASASGGSNWGASNPLLRDRAARATAALARYRDGRSPTIGEDVEAWFRARPADFVTRWAETNPAVARQWVSDNTEAVAAWLAWDETRVKADADAASRQFWKEYARKADPQQATWPVVETRAEGGQSIKRVKPAREGAEVRAYLFEAWLQDLANREKAAALERVPSDLVLASGSGLDPHITLKAALYQLDRVVAARAKEVKDDTGRVRREIEALVREKAETPLAGLAGVPLVNVLELNLALDALMKRSAVP